MAPPSSKQASPTCFCARKTDPDFFFLGKAASFALQGDVLTVRHEGRGRAAHAGQAFVLEVALTPERRLAQADAALVRANLAERGFHLQLPPQPLAPVKIARIDGRDD